MKNGAVINKELFEKLDIIKLRIVKLFARHYNIKELLDSNFMDARQAYARPRVAFEFTTMAHYAAANAAY